MSDITQVATANFFFYFCLHRKLYHNWKFGTEYNLENVLDIDSRDNDFHLPPNIYACLKAYY